MLKLKLSTLEKTHYEEVKTIKEARERVRDFIDELDLLASTLGDCKLYDETGKYLGWISYNCRFWPESEACNE